MGAGRPKKIIDYKVVKGLASVMCTQEEIAEILDISVRTLQRDKEFCRIYKKGLETGKMSLRRKQFALADRNPAMAIFLGKNYLGQTDKQEIGVTEYPKTIILVEGAGREKKEEGSSEEEEGEKIIIDVNEESK